MTYVMDTRRIGRKIATARKEKNLTQLALADQLGVSYQAVSNWERGQSAPDIEKLPDLAEVLDISLNELFDMAGAENKITVLRQSEAPVDVETLTEFAPLVKPHELSKKVEVSRKAAGFEPTAEEVRELAPFLNEDTLSELLKEQEVGPGYTELLRATAPFLGSANLAARVQELVDVKGTIDMDLIVHLASFLDSDAVGALFDQLENKDDITEHQLQHLFPIMDSARLADLVLLHEHDIHFISKVAPFLERDVLGQLVKRLSTQADVSNHDLAHLLPFVDSADLRDLVLHGNRDWDFVQHAAPFMDSEALGELVSHISDYGDNTAHHLRKIAPFLSSEDLSAAVIELIDGGTELSVKDLRGFMPFLDETAMLTMLRSIKK